MNIAWGMNAVNMKGNKMKVEKGQILEGINPYTGEKEYFKYLGNEDEYLASKGFKRKLKQKVKELKYYIREGKLTSKEAKKYLAGHLGYLKIANVNNLTKKIFYLE